MMWFGPLLLLLFLGVLAAVAIYAARRAGGAGAPRPPAQSALDILKERFARGEIDTAEFEERRRVLGD